VGIILVSGCLQFGPINGDPDYVIAKRECIKLCESILQATNENISHGPCLSDNVEGYVEDWVCDVAHSPRQPVDNLPENQCQEFREGRAKHFVEVDPDCNFIKAV